MKSLNAIYPAVRFGIGLVVLLTSLLSGCGYGGGTGYSTPTTLSSIAITPSSTTVTVGMPARLTATGRYSDGTTADITALVTWSSAAPATASVEPGTGVVTGNAVGMVNITAAVNNGTMYGGVTSASSAFTVTAATVNAAITIAPLTASVISGANTTFTATGGFSDGTTGNISGSVSWASSDISVAIVNASGIATGVRTGSATISATLNGISNTATLAVL